VALAFQIHEYIHCYNTLPHQRGTPDLRVRHKEYPHGRSISDEEWSWNLFNAPRERRPLAPLPPSRLGDERMVVDPICKMEVDPKSAKWKSSYNGKEYYFCAPGCKKAFDKNPEKYV